MPVNRISKSSSGPKEIEEFRRSDSGFFFPLKEKTEALEFSGLSRRRKELMGRFLQHYNKEYVKMAMLKQEETFVDQVNELHRLYQVQRTLMGDLKKKKKKRQQQETTTDVDLTLAIGSSRNSTRKREEEEKGRSDSGGTSQLSSTSTESMGEALKLYDWGRIQMPDMNVNCDRTEANRTSWREDLDLCLVRS